MKMTHRVLYTIVGAILFAVSVNTLLIPAQIYNGGLTGIAQLLRDISVSLLGLDNTLDPTGMIYFALNIPIFIFAWNKLSKHFVMLSLVSITVQSISLTFIPIPSKPIVDDVFIAIALAGVLGSYGCSLAYKAKGSAGGLDVIGFYFSQKNKGSLGKLYLVVNFIIYSICFVQYNAQIALYSLVYSFVFSYGLDKFHEHNLEASVMVFTKNKEIKREVMDTLRRGVTHWPGFGAYTGAETDVFVTIVAQSEVADIKKLIKKHDPKAFIIVSKNLKVDGGFEKRLI